VVRIEDFLGLLDGIRRSSKGWVARCPAHDDRSPSLSIAIGEDKQILLHCHAGCEAEAIVRAVGKTMADLFTERKGGGRAAPEPELVRELGSLRLRVAGCRLGKLGARLAIIAEVVTAIGPIQMLRGEVAGWDDRDLGRLARRLLAAFEDKPAPATEPEVIGALRGLADTAAARAQREREAGGRLERADAQGKALFLEDPEPWEQQVDGAVLLDHLAATYRRFVVLPEGAPEATALWVVHTHAVGAAYVSPYLSFVSPTPRCGKTRGLEVTAALVRRGNFASNITAPALFRTIEKYEPTLLVDELDAFLKMNDELRGVLNAGHSRASAVVIRTVGDDFEPRTFSTFCPKAVAVIGKLPAALEDRSIVILMRRRTREERVERLRLDRLRGELEPLRRRAVRWAADCLQALRAADPEVPETLNDRAQDNWRPLLAIADVAGGAWPRRARDAAVALSAGTDVGDEDLRILLLADLRDLFAAELADQLSTKVIIEVLVAMEERPWGDFGKKGKAITPEKLSRLLRPFGVRSKHWRDGAATSRGYLLEDLRDPFKRYLPPLPGSQRDTPDTSQQDQGVNAESDPAHKTGCVGFENRGNPGEDWDVSGVPSSNPLEGEYSGKEGGKTPGPERDEVPFEVPVVPPNHIEPGWRG
jgi:hypothetical protein